MEHYNYPEYNVINDNFIYKQYLQTRLTSDFFFIVFLRSDDNLCNFTKEQLSNYLYLVYGNEYYFSNCLLIRTRLAKMFFKVIFQLG